MQILSSFSLWDVFVDEKKKIKRANSVRYTSFKEWISLTICTYDIILWDISLPTASHSSTLSLHNLALILSEYSFLMGIGATVTVSAKPTLRFFFPSGCDGSIFIRLDGSCCIWCCSFDFFLWSYLYFSGTSKRFVLSISRVLLFLLCFGADACNGEVIPIRWKNLERTCVDW